MKLSGLHQRQPKARKTKVWQTDEHQGKEGKHGTSGPDSAPYHWPSGTAKADSSADFKKFILP